MNPYANEDLMWQRLKDLQREAENRRLIRAEGGGRGEWLRRLGGALRESAWVVQRGMAPRWWAERR